MNNLITNLYILKNLILIKNDINILYLEAMSFILYLMIWSFLTMI